MGGTGMWLLQDMQNSEADLRESQLTSLTVPWVPSLTNLPSVSVHLMSIDNASNKKISQDKAGVSSSAH